MKYCWLYISPTQELPQWKKIQGLFNNIFNNIHEFMFCTLMVKTFITITFVDRKALLLTMHSKNQTIHVSYELLSNICYFFQILF